MTTKQTHLRKCEHYLKSLCVDIADRSIFLQHGCPAIAATSAWMLAHMHDQTITHTLADTIDNVDCRKLVELAGAIKKLLLSL